ncbi:MAG: nitrilase-related carbon-nitrogen hydrolase, partial [Bacteroidales bacterium]
MRIGYIQTSPVFGERQKNLDAVDKMLYGIKADLIVLPELFATGYTFQTMDEVADLSENPDDVTSRYLCQKSLDTGSAIVAGFIERDENSYYNSAYLINSGIIIGLYRKLHLFNKEKLFFSPGTISLKVHKIKGVKIGMMICFDWIFPEVSRILALQGAQVIAHPSNLVLPYCQEAMKTRCIENRIFAVTSNRIGTEKRGTDEFIFTGGSQITSCSGEILSSAPHDSSSIDFVDIDPTQADNKMINPYNDLL